jgi:hypothetical protein
MRVIISIAVAVLVNGSVWANSLELNFENVSKLPIHSYENKKAKSKNFLVTQKLIFTNSNLNYYLFPNWSETERANYQFRASKKRAKES